MQPAKKIEAPKDTDDNVFKLSMRTLRFTDVEAQSEFTDYLRKEVFQQSKYICAVFLLISLATAVVLSYTPEDDEYRRRLYTMVSC